MYLTQPPKTMSVMHARHHLGEIVELVKYTNQQFCITRNNRPMARLVGEPFMQALERLMKSDPMLAETLANMVDAETISTLAQGIQNTTKENLQPLASTIEE